jgi:hypothetical protein
MKSSLQLEVLKFLLHTSFSVGVSIDFLPLAKNAASGPLMKLSIHCSKWHALITFGATDLLLPFNIGHIDTKSELNTTKLLQCYLTVSLTANAASSILA